MLGLVMTAFILPVGNEPVEVDRHYQVNSNNTQLVEMTRTFYNYIEEEDNQTIQIQIDTLSEIENLLDKLYTKLPKNMVIKTESSDLDILYKEIVHKDSTIRGYINRVGLTNYTIRKQANCITIEDNSHKVYTSRQIHNALTEFVNDLTPKLRGNTIEEDILNVYNYLYDNFAYNAKSRQKMKVGNIGNFEMACNGFSYLSYKLFSAMGYKVELREGVDHYWVVLYLDNIPYTFDVTSDILLQKKYHTLGVSSEEHRIRTLPIGIYSVAFDKTLYETLYYTGKIHKTKVG